MKDGGLVDGEIIDVVGGSLVGRGVAGGARHVTTMI